MRYMQESAHMIAKNITLTGLGVILVIVAVLGHGLGHSLIVATSLLSCETLLLWYLSIPNHRFPLVFNFVKPQSLRARFNRRQHELFAAILSQTLNHFAKVLLFFTTILWIISLLVNHYRLSFSSFIEPLISH